MTTNQLTSGAAIAFAAFAAWYALKGRTSAARTETDAEKMMRLAGEQRREVGDYIQENVRFAEDMTSQYAKRQGISTTSTAVDILGHDAAYYAFNPSYALGT